MNNRPQEPTPPASEVSTFWSQDVVVVDQPYGVFPSTASLFWFKTLDLVAATVQALDEGETVQLFMTYEQYAGGPQRTAVLGRFDGQHMGLDLKGISLTTGEKVVFHAASSKRATQTPTLHDGFRTVCVYGQAIENTFWEGILKSTLFQRYWAHAALTASGVMWLMLFVAWFTALLVGRPEKVGAMSNQGGGGSAGGAIKGHVV